MKIKLLFLFTFCSFNLFSQINLVPNNGFETWTNTTTLSDWKTENDVTQNTSNFTEGNKSAKLSLTYKTHPPKITTLVPMTAGTTYTVKFKYKYVTSNYNGQHPIALNISQDGSATTLSSSTFATDNNWTVKETTFTPDQSMSYELSISLFTFDDAAFNVNIDAVQVYVQGTEEYTLIPDVIFENKLIALGIDTGAADGKVLTNDINKLTALNVSYSSITDLTGIQDFVSLTYLNCYSNQLTTLDVPKSEALTFLDCGQNQLTTLDVSANVALKTLQCTNNKLTTLDVSKNLNLTEFYCLSNQLTSLDVSKNVALKKLVCYYNQITSFDFSKNLELNYLDCSHNKLTVLDVSNNVALTDFSCIVNQLAALDVSKNEALTSFSCDANKITTLDVSKNIALKAFYCSDNQLTTLDVSKNVALHYFNCRGNQLTALDVSKSVALKTLHCYLNDITALDVSKNVALKDFNCYGNQLTSLDVSKNVALTYLYCQSNKLTTLDVSKNTLLTELDCYNNKLVNLNLKNGNNSSLNMQYSSFRSNQYLTCIQVDNAAYSNDYWTNAKDYTAAYNENCTPSFLISDYNFEQKLIDLGIDTDGVNGKIDIANISSITSLDLSNSAITDLTGIENFTALQILDCSNNQLTSLDLSKNTNLQILYVTGNPLKYINLQNGNNQNLITASITGKKVSDIPGTSFLGITTLGCIKVDNADYSNANWSGIKEATTIYSETCTLGIEDSEFSKAVVYPNPTTGEVNILNITLEKAAVYNALGQLVKTFTLDAANTNNTINLSGLPKGVYYIYLINQDAASAKKIIVE